MIWGQLCPVRQLISEANFNSIRYKHSKGNPILWATCGRKCTFLHTQGSGYICLTWWAGWVAYMHVFKSYITVHLPTMVRTQPLPVPTDWFLSLPKVINFAMPLSCILVQGTHISYAFSINVHLMTSIACPFVSVQELEHQEKVSNIWATYV